MRETGVIPPPIHWFTVNPTGNSGAQLIAVEALAGELLEGWTYEERYTCALR